MESVPKNQVFTTQIFEEHLLKSKWSHPQYNPQVIIEREFRVGPKVIGDFWVWRKKEHAQKCKLEDKGVEEGRKVSKLGEVCVRRNNMKGHMCNFVCKVSLS